MNCREVKELAPFYVAGALLPVDEAAVRAHIAFCGKHAGAFRELEAAIAQPHPEGRSATPRALKSRIMDAIRDDDYAQRVASPRRRIGGQPVAGLAALATVLVLISGLLSWNIQLRSELAHQGAFVITLRGESGASGWMIYDDAPEFGVIGVKGLAPLPSDQTYQVWASTPRGPRSCGLLTVASPALAFARMTGEVSHGQTVFVTVEPTGGSTIPSGTTVLSGARW